ncbi:hypothetical protein M8818_005875 [Zalaria obscura]|uniref:Uncharacterized protein n=1 Tax=Zalaria obscura TaxID=2024903 RepID=A0ACC3S7U3_9PEZI
MDMQARVRLSSSVHEDESPDDLEMEHFDPERQELHQPAQDPTWPITIYPEQINMLNCHRKGPVELYRCIQQQDTESTWEESKSSPLLRNESKDQATPCIILCAMPDRVKASLLNGTFNSDDRVLQLLPPRLRAPIAPPPRRGRPPAGGPPPPSTRRPVIYVVSMLSETTRKGLLRSHGQKLVDFLRLYSLTRTGLRQKVQDTNRRNGLRQRFRRVDEFASRGLQAWRQTLDYQEGYNRYARSPEKQHIMKEWLDEFQKRINVTPDGPDDQAIVLPPTYTGQTVRPGEREREHRIGSNSSDLLCAYHFGCQELFDDTYTMQFTIVYECFQSAQPSYAEHLVASLSLSYHHFGGLNADICGKAWQDDTETEPFVYLKLQDDALESGELSRNAAKARKKAEERTKQLEELYQWDEQVKELKTIKDQYKALDEEIERATAEADAARAEFRDSLMALAERRRQELTALEELNRLKAIDEELMEWEREEVRYLRRLRGANEDTDD